MITLQVHEAAKSKQNLYLYFIICTLALEIAAGDSFFLTDPAWNRCHQQV